MKKKTQYIQIFNARFRVVLNDKLIIRRTYIKSEKSYINNLITHKNSKYD